MTRIGGPSTKTIAYRILAALDSAPDGILTDAQLLPLLAFTNRSQSKLAINTAPLVAGNLALQLPGGLRILDRGRRYVHENFCAPVFDALPEPKPVVTGSMALPRTMKPFKPLSMARMMRGKPMRDGMDDYLSVPSLIGRTRVMLGDDK